jgi:hypothetical protein
MNTYLKTASTLTALALAPALLAQDSGAALYDFNGDPLVDPPATGAAPGDVLNSFNHTGLSDTDGLAPYLGGNLLASDSDGTVNEVDPTTGAVVNTFPVAETNDGWLGYDASRNLIITSNASSDRIKGYTPGNSVPVFDIPSPVPGPVGVAWDPTRDEYAVCDWELDQIVVIDAATLAVARFLPQPALTRMCGVGYDCVSDKYVVGDRDSTSHSLIDPVTGVIGVTYATATTGGSNPRGHAVSGQVGMWAGSFNNTLVVEQETDHAPVAGGCGGGGNLSLRCDPANNHSGGSYVTLASSSQSGPGVLHLEATDGPASEFGYFLVSLGIVEPGVAVSNGLLCLTAPTGRYAPAAGGTLNSIGQFDAAGTLVNMAGTSTVGTGYDVLATLPTPPGGVIQAGTSYYFQCWYRDGNRSNFSNVLQFQ